MCHTHTICIFYDLTATNQGLSTVFLRQVGIEEGGKVVSPNVTVRAPIELWELESNNARQPLLKTSVIMSVLINLRVKPNKATE